MRVVLDTNILISALWKPEGLEAKLVRLVREGTIVMCVSEALWEEYREVLSREKFARFGDAGVKLLSALGSFVMRVSPTEEASGSVDEDDNRVLECVEAAGAEYLITGNLRHFPAEWAGAKVVNARGFFGAL